MADLRSLFIKYTQGKCSSDEIVRLKRWIQSEEGESALEEFIEQQWNLPDEEVSPNSHQLFEKLQQQISNKEPVQVGRFIPVSHIGRYAASLIFVLLSAAFLFHYLNREKPPVHNVLMLSKKTTKGQKRTLHLTDGTQIILNAESELTFPEHFSDTLRMVFLDGEAFFDVAEDKTRPFIVQTPHIQIEVLGTSFNLSAYQEDSLSQIALLKGSVSVQPKQSANLDASLKLKPGEMAFYHKTAQNFTTGTFDEKALSSWKDGILYFNNAGYREIIKTLERWYGVEISYKGQEVPVWRYNGEFNGRSLEYVMESISYACEFTYVLEDTQVIIYNP